MYKRLFETIELYLLPDIRKIVLDYKFDQSNIENYDVEFDFNTIDEKPHSYLIFQGYDSKRLYLNYVSDHITTKLYYSITFDCNNPKNIPANDNDFIRSCGRSKLVCYHYNDILYMHSENKLCLLEYKTNKFKYYNLKFNKKKSEYEYLYEYYVTNSPKVASYFMDPLQFIENIIQLVVNENGMYLLVYNKKGRKLIIRETIEDYEYIKREILHEINDVEHITSANEYLIITNSIAQVILLDSNNKIYKQYTSDKALIVLFVVLVNNQLIFYCSGGRYYFFDLYKEAYFKFSYSYNNTSLLNLVYTNNTIYMICSKTINKIKLVYNEFEVTEL